MEEDIKTGEATASGGDPEQQGMAAEDYFRAGMLFLKREKYREALSAFKRALELQELDPRYLSYTGFCLAHVEKRGRDAVDLCEKAVRIEFYRPELFLNLGRVYLMAGNKRKAHQTFWKGFALDRDNKELRAELEKMGTRKPPVFPFLDRKHPLNRIIGKALYKLRLR